MVIELLLEIHFNGIDFGYKRFECTGEIFRLKKDLLAHETRFCQKRIREEVKRN